MAVEESATETPDRGARLVPELGASRGQIGEIELAGLARGMFARADARATPLRRPDLTWRLRPALR